MSTLPPDSPRSRTCRSIELLPQCKHSLTPIFATLRCYTATVHLTDSNSSYSTRVRMCVYSISPPVEKLLHIVCSGHRCRWCLFTPSANVRASLWQIRLTLNAWLTAGLTVKEAVMVVVCLGVGRKALAIGTELVGYLGETVFAVILVPGGICMGAYLMRPV